MDGDVRDVLADWDVGVSAARAPRADRRPFPIDAVAVCGGAVAGAAAAASLRGARLARSLMLGAVWGGTIAAAARRVWRLEP